MTNSHYETLGVAASAPIEVILAAQIALRQKYNPDNFVALEEKADALAMLKRIDEACAVLLNKEARAKYDAYLHYLADETYLDNQLNKAALDEPLKEAPEHFEAAYPNLPDPEPVQPKSTPPQIPIKTKKSPLPKIIGVLVAAFLLWLIYAIASVGYDFYRMSQEANSVNPATQIQVNEPQPQKEAGLIEIETKNNLSAKLATVERRVNDKQRSLDRLWQNASAGAREALSENQNAWERQTTNECLAMAKGESADERKLNELQCRIVKLEARHGQLDTFFKEYEAEEQLRQMAAQRQLENQDSADDSQFMPTEETPTTIEY